jgi:hypothetical protein
LIRQEREKSPRKEPMMRKILRIGKGVKIRRARVEEICGLPADAMAVDVKVELIQALIPIGLRHVKELLEQEVRQLAGISGVGYRDMTGGVSRGGCISLGSQTTDQGKSFQSWGRGIGGCIFGHEAIL